MNHPLPIFPTERDLQDMIKHEAFEGRQVTPEVLRIVRNNPTLVTKPLDRVGASLAEDHNSKPGAVEYFDAPTGDIVSAWESTPGGDRSPADVPFTKEPPKSELYFDAVRLAMVLRERAHEAQRQEWRMEVALRNYRESYHSPASVEALSSLWLELMQNPDNVAAVARQGYRDVGADDTPDTEWTATRERKGIWAKIRAVYDRFDG